MTRPMPPDGDALDDPADDDPLDAAEAAEGAAIAGGGTGETLETRLGTVIGELDGVAREPDGAGERLSAEGRVFALVAPGLLEVALDARVASAALATPDTRRSSRGAGWVAFTPTTADRFALDRAEAWLRLAHRRALERGRD